MNKQRVFIFHTFSNNVQLHDSIEHSSTSRAERASSTSFADTSTQIHRCAADGRPIFIDRTARLRFVFIPGL